MNNIAQFLQTELSSGNLSALIIFLSFLGGLIASLSPCNIAILPLILSYISGNSKTNTRKTAILLTLFVCGLSLTFSILGAITAISGIVFISLISPYWILIIASILLILGLHLIGVLDLKFPTLVKQFPNTLAKHEYLYAFLFGIVFAFAATPCTTPILAGILAASTLTKNVLVAVLMLFAFSLGQSIIIILAGVFTSFLIHLRKIQEHTEILNKISGFLLILFALFIYAKLFLPFL